MEFRRINNLPPYVFTIINDLKIQGRRNGDDIIDFGFGNPDLPSPDIAVEKLCEAAQNPRNHRYSLSRGLPKLREAICDLYENKFGVTLNPVVQAGDAVLVPSPSYPIHLYAPLFAGAEVREIPLSTGSDFFGAMQERWEYSWPRPKVILLSFPHNPTTTCVDLDFMQQVVDFAKEKDVLLVHDFAYADLGFDDYQPPSILQADGGKDVAVELYSMTKSFFMLGNSEVVAALAKLNSYLDYGTFQPIQIAATVTMNEASDHPKLVKNIYESRRDSLCEGLNRIGWEIDPPQGTMFAWAKIPDVYSEMGSIEIASWLVQEAKVATSPGIGFGPGGEGYVRFALIENEQRTSQAIRQIKNTLTKL